MAQAEEAEQKRRVAEEEKEAALLAEKAEKKRREEEVAAAAAEAEAAAEEATRKMEVMEQRKQEASSISSKPSFGKPNLLARRRDQPTPTGAQEPAGPTGLSVIPSGPLEARPRQPEPVPFSKRMGLQEGSRGSGVASTPNLVREREETKNENPYEGINKDQQLLSHDISAPVLPGPQNTEQLPPRPGRAGTRGDSPS